MINYSQYQINQFAQHYFQMLQSQPFIDLNHLHLHGLIDQTNPPTNDDHIQERQHADGLNALNRDLIDHSEHLIPIISHLPQHHDFLKHQEDSQQSKIKRKAERRLKNQTKNIPKNFGKGIISFIQKNQKKIRGLLQQHRLSYNHFKIMMKSQKKIINTIADLRRLWTDQTYGKCMRIISNLFFRRYSMNYIFNSRISNYSSHIKYRQSLWEALKNPSEFNHIKQY